MLNYIEFLGVPATVAIVIVAAFLIMQVVGEMLSFKGKVVPEIMNIRKRFRRKKDEKDETNKTLKEVKELLADVNSHYSADNITKRNSWMKWVNDRAEIYDNSIIEINKSLEKVSESLSENTKLTEEMFVENSRDRIIDFAEKVIDPNYIVSREQFRRIFRVYNDYESWLDEHGRTNGEIDMSYGIIQDAYTYRMNNHSFAEDLNKYAKQ